MKRKVLITGAGGALGSLLVRAFRDRYELRVTTREPRADGLFDGLEVRYATLGDLGAMEALCEGIDTVVHLGGRSLEDSWDEISRSNIDGAYAIFEAARRQRVRRLVYASSHHVGGFLPRDRVTGVTDEYRPDSLYGVSKVFGEALGRLYADKHGMSVICQRIGVCRPAPPHRRSLWSWLSEPDFVDLTVRCIEADGIHFHIVYGVSDNTRKQWDDSGARVIGFFPKDDAETFVPAMAGKLDEPAFDARFQGGAFCAEGFDGDPSRLD
ncbi:MAG: NAD-dependent epimerase/dehydratase family protein [Rhizobiaceae bacterium]